MRHVATGASFLLDGRVLEHKRPLLLGVTAGANLLLRGGQAQLMSNEASVRIMAIAALDKVDLDPMPEGTIELGLHRGMAAVAKLWLAFGEQELRLGGVVWRVAVQAAHVVPGVGGARKIALLQPVRLVAVQADARGLGRGQLGEAADLGGIAATFDVRLAGTVAVFAAVLAFFDQIVVGRALKTCFVDVFMAGLAGVAAHIAGRGRGLSGGLRRWRGNGLLCKAAGGQGQHKK